MITLFIAFVFGQLGIAYAVRANRLEVEADLLAIEQRTEALEAQVIDLQSDLGSVIEDARTSRRHARRHGSYK